MMRASDILGLVVRDADGQEVGQVHDIRLVRDAPIQGTFGLGYRVTGLVVGAAGIGVRLGFDRGAVRGPWILKRLFAWLHSDSRFVPWEQIDALADDELRLKAKMEALEPVRPLPR